VLTEALLGEAAAEAGLADPSIVVRRLDAPGGPAAALAPERPLYPASMIKVPLAAALTALWERGEASPDDRVTVAETNMTATDAASPFVPGYAATLEELATLMLTRSDNVATNVLIDAVGRERATALAAERGLGATAVRRKLSGSLPLIDDPEATGRNTHPAADAAALFAAIAAGDVPRSAWLFATLSRQEWNDKLSRGLLGDDRFAHKTGETDEVTHDGGILETADGARYVIVVYTALAAGPDADARFATFMRALRPFL
jgi:beta-lactamase class A